MSELPVIYLVDASTATTGALNAARHMAKCLATEARMVLVLPAHARIDTAMLRDFWRVDYLRLSNPSKRPSQLPRYLCDLWLTSLQLRRRMRRDGARALILNDVYLLHGLALRALGYRGKVLQWVRCDPQRFAGSLAPALVWLVGRAATALVAVSQFIANRLPAAARPFLLYDAYDGPTPPLRNHSLDEKRFLFIGNYIEGKGQDVALHALALVHRDAPTVRLHFHGGDMGLAKNEAYRARLEQEAQVLGIEDKVYFGGFVTDTAPLLAHAYAAINLSVSESFSMTVLEASGAGLPVIATRCGGPEEILVDGVTGYLVPVGDAQAAAERMLTLANAPIEARQMGAAGAARVRQLFSPEPFRSALLRLLETR